MPRKPIKIRFEKGVCGRCGGSGRFSWNAIDADRCYGCGGSGQVLTRAGKRARNAVREFIRERYSRPVEEVAAGMQVRFDGRWVRVIDHGPVGICKVKDRESGEWIESLTLVIAAGYTGSTNYCLSPGALVEVRPSAEQFVNEVVPKARRFKGASIIEEGE